MTGGRRKGRTRKRWLQDVEKDLNILHVTNWKAKAKQMETDCEGRQSPSRAVEEEEEDEEEEEVVVV
jgi:hypothetical protein